MRGALKAFVAATAIAFVCAPAQARADGYVSPWVAANASAGLSNGNVDFDNGKSGFGVNAGGMGGGIFGAEVGFGYTPSFFGSETDFGKNHVLDLMGNVIVGIPVGGTHGPGIRPFVTAGLGLLRREFDGGVVVPFSSTHNDLGWNAGAGVMGFLSDHVGLRGDVRYLRTINSSSADVGDLNFNFSEGDFHFWRASAGVVIR